MKLDIKKWNEARKELEKNIKEFKSRRTESGQPHWDEFDGGALKNMKWDATTLYAVRAACRNRQHCAGWTIEDAKEIILPQYSIPEQDKLPDIVIP